MSKSIILSTLVLVSSLAQSRSLMPPRLDGNFSVECQIDVFVSTVARDSGRMFQIQNRRGQIVMTPEDIAFNADKLPAKIQWTNWDMAAQKSVPASLTELPGAPVVTELSGSLRGHSDNSGRLGSFGITLAVEFTAADNSLVEVKHDDSAEAGESLQTKATASHSIGNRKVQYMSQLDCKAGPKVP